MCTHTDEDSSSHSHIPHCGYQATVHLSTYPQGQEQRLLKIQYQSKEGDTKASSAQRYIYVYYLADRSSVYSVHKYLTIKIQALLVS